MCDFVAHLWHLQKDMCQFSSNFFLNHDSNKHLGVEFDTKEGIPKPHEDILCL